VEIVYDSAAFPRLPNGSAITIGAFDGVHRGHQALIGEVRRLAQELGAASVVTTFDRHPASVVRPDSAPRLLTNLTQKLELLAETGVDYAYVLHFDEERSLEDPLDFVQQVVVDALQARVVVVGDDFHFGHRRRGDVALLSEVGAAEGFKVIGLGLIEIPGIDGPVSSSAVRAAISEGNVTLAAELLGHPYQVHGVVEHGDGRGRTIGFPTANVAVPGDVMLPADGVYAGWYQRPDGQVWRAAISVGRRPTFYLERGTLLLEAFLLDFDGDLYGEHARVTIERWLRPLVRYDSVDDLVVQLHHDVDATRLTSH
jgi:riboflavin kinase / FMN adenylyltransferase